MKDLIDLYYNSKNLQSFFSLLNKKYNKHLLNKFNEFKKNTCYFYMCHYTNQEQQALYDYSRCIGIAFQITDDILDVVGNVESMGKNLQKDAGLMRAFFINNGYDKN